jgi:hypothetical protein
MFQFMSHSVRSMTASRLRCPRVLPNASAAGAVHGALGLDRLRDALDGQVARDDGGAVLAEVELGRGERDLGVVRGVEELGAQDVGAELLGGADRDRLDLRGADQATTRERRLDRVERAAEDGDALVADGEAEARVDRISVVRAGERRGSGGHGRRPPGVSCASADVSGGDSGYACRPL